MQMICSIKDSYVFSTFSTCTGTVTYSFWLKLMKTQIATSSTILKTYRETKRPGLHFISDANSGFSTKVAISKYKRWEISNHGLHVNKARWNHFTVTVDDNKMLCVFINGKKDQCVTSAVSVNLGMGLNNQFRFGGGWGISTIPGMYLDDFAVWLTVLPDSEIFNLYIQSKDYDK